MATAIRSRRAARASGDERERAIVDAFEALLQTRAMTDIAIDDVATRAGLSRSAFYFYFASKHAVLLELLDRMVAETDRRLGALGVPGDDPAAWWRGCIGVFIEVFGAHRAVTATLAEARATVPEVRDEWSRRSSRWIEQTASAIVAERRRGRAREIVDPRATAIALNAMNEQAIAAALAGAQPAIPADELLEVLADVWLAAIYGRDTVS